MINLKKILAVVFYAFTAFISGELGYVLIRVYFFPYKEFSLLTLSLITCAVLGFLGSIMRLYLIFANKQEAQTVESDFAGIGIRIFFYGFLLMITFALIILSLWN